MNSSREFFPSLRMDRRFVVRNRKVTTEVDGNRGTEGYDREGPFEAPEVRRVRTRRSEGSELRRLSSDEDLSRSAEGLRYNRAFAKVVTKEDLSKYLRNEGYERGKGVSKQP